MTESGKIPLGTLTTPSTAITKETAVEVVGATLTLGYEFDRDGRIFSGGVRFERVRAYRFRAESHCTVWHIKDAYDTIVEVSPSDWIAELLAAQPPGMGGDLEPHHYLLYIDSTGCFEIAAASWSLLLDEPVA